MSKLYEEYAWYYCKPDGTVKRYVNSIYDADHMNAKGYFKTPEEALNYRRKFCSNGICDLQMFDFCRCK